MSASGLSTRSSLRSATGGVGKLTVSLLRWGVEGLLPDPCARYIPCSVSKGLRKEEPLSPPQKQQRKLQGGFGSKGLRSGPISLGHKSGPDQP